MNEKCLKFRKHLLQEDTDREFNTDQADHFNTCADCREFTKKTRSALDFLQKGKTIDIPVRIEEKLDKQLFEPKAVFRPAIVFSTMLLVLISSFIISKSVLTWSRLISRTIGLLNPFKILSMNSISFFNLVESVVLYNRAGLQ